MHAPKGLVILQEDNLLKIVVLACIQMANAVALHCVYSEYRYWQPLGAVIYKPLCLSQSVPAIRFSVVMRSMALVGDAPQSKGGQHLPAPSTR